MFSRIEEYLREGRELEFSKGGIPYAVTNHDAAWYFYSGEEEKSIALCGFDDKDTLIERISNLTIDGKTVKMLLDKGDYDKDSLIVF